MEQRRAHQPHAAKVKVVAQRTLLIIYYWMSLADTLLYRITVAINHSSLGIASHQHHTLQCRLAQLEGKRFQTEQGIGRYGMFSDQTHEAAV